MFIFIQTYNQRYKVEFIIDGPQLEPGNPSFEAEPQAQRSC